MNTSAKVHENLSLKNIDGEIWKDIPDYEGCYQVSNFGRVKSLERKQKRFDSIIKQRFNKYGYLYVTLNKPKRRSYEVHQLVAISFLNHVPNGNNDIIDHKNNIKYDNFKDNLQITTARINSSKDKIGYTSKYVGVSWKPELKKWRSTIYFNGKAIHLGVFENEELANDYYQNALISIKNNQPIKKFIQRKKISQ